MTGDDLCYVKCFSLACISVSVGPRLAKEHVYDSKNDERSDYLLNTNLMIWKRSVYLANNLDMIFLLDQMRILGRTQHRFF